MSGHSSPATVAAMDDRATGGGRTSTARAGKPAGAAPVGKRPRSALERARRRLYYWFLIPAGLLYTLFLVAPTVVTGWISLNRWAGAGPMSFVGLGNYRMLLGDPVFRQAFGNTLLILFVVGGATFLVSFALMLLLREIRGRRFIRSVVFFPNIVSGVALSIVWGFLFQQEGMVNAVLKSVGVAQPPAWLAEHRLFFVIMLGLIWINTGFYTTILLAAVDRIPAYLFEDCELAGATAWQRMRYVVLPLTRDVIGVAAILWTISSIKIFEFIFAFAGGAGYLPPTTVWNAAVYSYAAAFSAVGLPQYGAAAASSLVTLLLVGVAVGLMRRIFGKNQLEY